MTPSKLAEAKKVVLDTILQKASEGMLESQVYHLLYDYDKKYKIFEYGIDEINPSSIIEALIFKGFIIKVCQNYFEECKIYPNEIILNFK